MPRRREFARRSKKVAVTAHGPCRHLILNIFHREKEKRKSNVRKAHKAKKISVFYIKKKFEKMNSILR